MSWGGTKVAVGSGWRLQEAVGRPLLAQPAAHFGRSIPTARAGLWVVEVEIP